MRASFMARHEGEECVRWPSLENGGMSRATGEWRYQCLSIGNGWALPMRPLVTGSLVKVVVCGGSGGRCDSGSSGGGSSSSALYEVPITAV